MIFQLFALGVLVFFVVDGKAAECVPSTTVECPVVFILSWDPSDTATRYKYRWRTDGKAFNDEIQTTETSVEFTHSMKVGERISATVVACNDAGCSDRAWVGMDFNGYVPPKASRLRLRMK